MNSTKPFFLFITLLYLLPLTNRAQASIADSVDNILNDELELLNNFYNDHITLSYTLGPTVAKPNAILINRSQLLGLHKKVQQEDFRNICALVLAHEYAHVLQMKDTSLGIHTGLTRYEAKILEAQADILAGRYCTVRLFPVFRKILAQSIEKGRSMAEYQAQFRSSRKISINAMDFFFNIGTATFSAGDHPTRQQRLTGVLRGQIAAVPYIMDFYLEQPAEVSGVTLTKADRDKLILTKEFAEHIIDYRESQGLMKWSYEQAKMITHGNSRYLSHVIRMSEDVSWNTDVHPSLCFITLRLKNIGQQDLKGKLNFHIVQEIDSVNGLNNFTIQNAVYHEVLLKSQQEITIIDTLPFEPDMTLSNVTDVHENASVLQLPPDEYSLYYFEPYKAGKTLAANPSGNRELKLEDGSPELSFEVLVEFLRGNIADLNIEELVTGAGKFYSYDSSEYVVYNCLTPTYFNRTGTLTHYLQRDGKSSGDNRIKYTIARLKSQKDAKELFLHYKEKLKELYPEQDHDEQAFRSREEFTVIDDKEATMIRIAYIQLKNINLVELTIRNLEE